MQVVFRQTPLEPSLLTESWFFGCRNTKNLFEIKRSLWSNCGTGSVENRYVTAEVMSSVGEAVGAVAQLLGLSTMYPRVRGWGLNLFKNHKSGSCSCLKMDGWIVSLFSAAVQQPVEKSRRIFFWGDKGDSNVQVSRPYRKLVSATVSFQTHVTVSLLCFVTRNRHLLLWLYTKKNLQMSCQIYTLLCATSKISILQH